MSEEIIRNQSMLTMEGFTLMICIFAGGIALLYYVFREVRQAQKQHLLFATFSHELRTPLASLKLQAESLREDLLDTQHHSLVERIVSDTARLSLQLDNSLLLATLNEYQILLEKLSLREVVNSLKHRWPGLRIEVTEDVTVECDRHALESIITNLIQNALVHGKATEVTISPKLLEGSRVEFTVLDNGQGFSGNIRTLGKPFVRHTKQSGNGIGLYLCKQLAKKMGGAFRILTKSNGFGATVTLKGAAV